MADQRTDIDFNEWRNSFADLFRLECIGEYKHRVYTPFMFDDGDHYVIELVKINERYAYSDTGHTEMHLDILDVPNFKTTEMYYAVADNLKALYRVETCNAALYRSVRDGESHGKACMDLVRAIDYMIDYRSHRIYTLKWRELH